MYTTIKKPVRASFTEKRSEFIGQLCPVKTDREAVDFINYVRSENRKAKHNVYAYILRDNNMTRYSDDGEPQGTAGMPVLDVLQKNALTDICCVVTRYFGGILLGGGGLVRAYSHSAAIAVDEAELMRMYEAVSCELTVSYDMYGKAGSILPQFEVKQSEPEFGADVKIKLFVKKELYEPMVKKLTEVTAGRLELEKKEELFEDF